MASNNNNNKNIKFPEPQVIEGSIKSKDTIEVKASRGEVNTSVRRNRSSTISRTDKYKNIEGGVIPFIYGGGYGKYTSNISIKDTIILCQKAYYNFSIFRNTIDLMTEFSCSPIYFTGGNEQSRKFFQAWADRVNLWRLQDMFFREFFRSGNVFLYKLNAQFTKQDMRVLSDLITTEARAGERAAAAQLSLRARAEAAEEEAADAEEEAKWKEEEAKKAEMGGRKRRKSRGKLF